MTRRPTHQAMSADQLRLTTQANALVAQPSGEIDLSNAERLGTRIAEATPAGSVGVALDLTDVTFIDSFGIYVTIGLSQRLAKDRQSLVLVVPEGSPLLGIFRVSNVESHLRIVGTIDEALGMLEQERSTAA